LKRKKNLRSISQLSSSHRRRQIGVMPIQHQNGCAHLTSQSMYVCVSQQFHSDVCVPQRIQGVFLPDAHAHIKKTLIDLTKALQKCFDF
jgi:hypothetical protein